MLCVPCGFRSLRWQGCARIDSRLDTAKIRSAKSRRGPSAADMRRLHRHVGFVPLPDITAQPRLGEARHTFPRFDDGPKISKSIGI